MKTDATNKSLAHMYGTCFTQAPLCAVVGVSLTYEQLDAYTEAILAAHDAGLQQHDLQPWQDKMSDLSWDTTHKPRKISGYNECRCILSQYCDGECRPIYECAMA